MKGTINRIPPGKMFGFINANNKGDYFFHKDDFEGHWSDLINDITHGPIEVSFEVTESEKGLRASKVRRLDFPNSVGDGT
jgi:cold shock CspA family protein